MAIDPGQKFVRRHNAARSSTSNTTAADISYDTAVFSEGGYSWSSPEVTVDTAGLYLCMFDIGEVALASTRAVGTLVPSVNTTDQTLYKARHRYLRNSGGNHNASWGTCILDLSASDDVKIRNPGSVSGTDALGNYATNVNQGGGFQMVRLNAGNFTEVQRTSSQSPITITYANATRPWLDSTPTLTQITFNSEVRDDDNLYSGSGGDLTLAANTKYLIVYGATFDGSSSQRHTHHLVLDIGGTNRQYSTGYERNNSSDGPPMQGMYLHETGGSSETLRLYGAVEQEDNTVSNTVGCDNAFVQVLELPDGAEWIHVDNGTTDSLTTALAGTSTYYDTPLSSTFRADGDSELSLDSSNNAVQNDSGGTESVLAIGWHMWDRDAGTSGTRKHVWSYWDNGGTRLAYGISGGYNRGQQGNDDTHRLGFVAGAVMDLANAADLSFVCRDPVNAANSDMGVYASDHRHFLGVQVLRLDTLAAAADIVEEPGAGSLTLTGQTPTVLTTLSAEPGAGSCTLTGHIPSVTVSVSLAEEPGSGSLTLTGHAPTLAISDNHTASPGAGSLTLTGYIEYNYGGPGLRLVGFEPTVAIEVPSGDTIEPGAGSLTLTGQAPTIDRTENVIEEPGAGSLTLTGQTPTITVNHIVSPGTGSLTITGEIPLILVSITVEPGNDALVLTGHIPTLVQTFNHIRGPPVGSLALTGQIPTIDRTENHFPAPGIDSLILTGHIPTIVLSDNVIEEPGAGGLTLVGYVPTTVRTENHFPQPGIDSLILTGYAPTLDLTANHFPAPGTGSIACTGYAPAISVGQSIIEQPGTGSLTLTGYAPTAVRTENHFPQPGIDALILTGYAPTLDLTANHFPSPGVGSLTCTGHAPVADSGNNVVEQPDQGSLTLTGYAPTLALTADHFPAPDAGSAALTGYAPTAALSVNQVVEPGAGAITCTGYAPSTGGADTTAPVLSEPTLTAISTTEGTGTVVTNEGNGILYYWASENPTETAATIKMFGQQAVTQAGIQEIYFFGGEPQTRYWAHYVQDDAALNESNVVSSQSAVTWSGGKEPAQIIWFQYDRELKRREAEQKRRKKAEKKTRKIKDDLMREIAEEQRRIEAEEARIAELTRLTRIAEENKEALIATNEALARSIEVATERQTFSAMERLERELARQKEEEEFLLMAAQILLNAEYVH